MATRHVLVEDIPYQQTLQDSYYYFCSASFVGVLVEKGSRQPLLLGMLGKIMEPLFWRFTMHVIAWAMDFSQQYPHNVTPSCPQSRVANIYSFIETC